MAKTRCSLSEHWTKWPKETEFSPLGYSYNDGLFRAEMFPKRSDDTPLLWYAECWKGADKGETRSVRGLTLWECATNLEAFLKPYHQAEVKK